MVIEELRKADRFVVTDPITITFGPTDGTLLNLSLGGAQVTHPQPMRIGTLGRLAFRRGDVVVTTQARVVWSHVVPSPGRKLAYRTGLRIEAVDPQYAMAINALLRAGAIHQDRDSLDRKREREQQREEKRKSGPQPLSPPG